MAAKVVEVPVERHALQRRPVAVGEAGGRADVGDARRPRCVVGLIVLRAERLQPEVVADQRRRRLEVRRDERGRHGPRHAVLGEHGREAAGVEEDDLGARAPASGRSIAEQAGEALAGVCAVEDPASVQGGPADRLVTSRGRNAVVGSEPAAVDFDVAVGDLDVRLEEGESRARQHADIGVSGDDALGDADRQHLGQLVVPERAQQRSPGHQAGMGPAARRRVDDCCRAHPHDPALLDELDVRGDVTERADRGAAADRDRVRRRTLRLEVGSELLAGDLQLAPMGGRASDEVQLGSEQLGEQLVARRPRRPRSGEHEVDLEAEHGARRRRHPAVVRLRGAHGHQRAGTAAERVAAQELQLAGLVPTGTKAGEVVALQPQTHTAGQPRPPLQWRGQGSQARPRQGLQTFERVRRERHAPMVGTVRRRIVGSMTTRHTRRGLLAGGVLVTGVTTAWFGRRRAARSDAVVVRYGDHPAQFVELTVPAGGQEAPVAAVIHGGFWRQRYDLSLGRPLAATLPARGWAALNIEYRRVDGGGGYPATLDDVAAAIDALADVDAALDLRSVVTIGHSAGGHLAAWAATRRDPAVPVTGVVSQAGVLDLRRAALDRLGAGATQAFLGGDPSQVPERYDDASPMERLPLGVPVLCVHGRADTNVPISQSEDFVAAAKTAGDDVELQAVDGDHFVVIDPTSDAWARVLRWLDERRP